jgi:hypothetical protein
MRKEVTRKLPGRKAALLAAVLCAASAGALARNDPLMVDSPDAAGVRGYQANVPLRYGKATEVSGEASMGHLETWGTQDTYSPVVADPTARRERRPDADVCQDAYRKAVVYLQNQAVAAGGVAVVGIVSVSNGNGVDNTRQFECRIGRSRALVELRGQAARSLPAALSR